MAINKKLIKFATQARFDIFLANGDIDTSSVVFIEDTGRLWTQGRYYDPSWGNILNKPTKLSDFTDNLGIDTHMADNVKHITAAERTKWNTAYGWGDFRDYGLGVTASVNKNPSDKNTLPSGLYGVSTTASESPVAGSSGTLLHMRSAASGNTYWSQLYILGNGGETPRAFISHGNAGRVAEWKELWHKGNLANGTIFQYIRGDGSLATYTDTTYSTMSAAEILDGKATTARTITSKVLNDWINGKNYATVGYVNSTLPTSTKRDFVNGTLITTSINYANANGDPFYLNIKGNSYGRNYSVDTIVQGYIYNNTITNYGVTHKNPHGITGIIAMNVGGKLCFWFPRQGYWEGYSIMVTTAFNYNINTITGITDVVKPAGTKEVNLSSNTKQGAYRGDKLSLFSNDLGNYGDFALQSISITAGNGLTGGGTLAADRTITLGTPSNIDAKTTNSVSASSHTHALTSSTVNFTSLADMSNTLNGMVSGYAGGPIGSNSVVGTWTTLASNNSYGGGFFTRLGRAFTLGKENGVIGEWQELAYLTSNVASATKLQTARTIWGQSFDGTGNVSGALSGASTGSFSSTLSANRIVVTSTSNEKHLEFSRSDYNYITSKGHIGFITGGTETSSANQQVWIHSNGNTKIGAGSSSVPAYTLDVNGTGRFTGNVTAPTFIGALSGNASSATLASTLTINSSASASWFDILWNSGTTVYGSASNKLRVQPSTGSITSGGTITASNLTVTGKVSKLTDYQTQASTFDFTNTKVIQNIKGLYAVTTTNGYIAIGLPKTSNTMPDITVTISDYGSKDLVKYRIQGYWYGSYWHGNANKTIIEASSSINPELLKVTLAADQNGNPYILIGTPTTKFHSYINVNLDEIKLKYDAQSNTAWQNSANYTISQGITDVTGWSLLTAAVNVVANKDWVTSNYAPLTTSAGSATQPVYFSEGKPVATTYSLGASVPSGAKFTDTNTYVTQAVSTLTTYRPILLGQNSTDSTSNFSNVTDQSYYSNALRMQPSTGNIISKGNVTATSFIGALSGNATTATTATNLSRSIIAGNGLTGGGALNADRTITLGTPSTITNSTTNSVTATSHTHSIDPSDFSVSSLRNTMLNTTTPATALSINYGRFSSADAGNLPVSNNANAILTMSKHSGNYDSQLAFSSNGNIYYRNFTGEALNTTKAWNKLAFTTDNVASATKLQTARTLTIGKTGKTFDGTANPTWTLDEIGVAASTHSHTWDSITNKPSLFEVITIPAGNLNYVSPYSGIREVDLSTHNIPQGAMGPVGNVLYAYSKQAELGTERLSQLYLDGVSSGEARLFYRAGVGNIASASWWSEWQSVAFLSDIDAKHQYVTSLPSSPQAGVFYYVKQ